MSPSTPDRRLRRALRLAARGRYRTSPNPMVGAVLVRDGEVVGEGWHRRVGGPHAEVEALRAAGERARGATLYVTLEPCSHHGRTPPCADAVVAAGVSRVVACHRDPNPLVAGEGFARLAAAGIEVSAGHLVDQAVALNWRFLTAVVRRRPAITVKWAMTLDGRIATSGGHSQWISSPGGRRWALALREEHDAVLVGSGTALADDPRLDRRLGLATGPATRVVLDRRLRLGAEARMLREGEGPVLVYTEALEEERQRDLVAAGAEVVARRSLGLADVLDDLFARGIQSVLVEGGSEVLGAFVAAELFDRVAIDVSPRLVGGREAPGPLGGRGAERLEDALRVEGLTLRRRQGDLILEGFRKGCLPDLSSSVASSPRS